MDREKSRSVEAQCTGDQPPACTAACPLRVDVRALAAKLRAGDLAGARLAFGKAVRFPRIVARTCHRPCEPACRRGEAGDPIAIGALERACVAHTPAPPPPRKGPARARRVAVAGGGPSGLAAAVELALKGYAVTIFEAGPALGGRLRALPEAALPAAELAADLQLLSDLGVEVHLGEPAPLAELFPGFDAVYLATGAGREGGHPGVDPVTLATADPRVFAGGGRRHGRDLPVVASLLDGRVAAISIDRVLQRASLTAAREPAGPVPTRLHVRPDRFPPSRRVAPSGPGGLSPAEAAAEAARCFPCECVECTSVCPYLARFGANPKRYVREIATNLELRKGDHTANRLTNACALCGLCQEVCPERLAFGAFAREARQEMVGSGRMPPSAHDLALRDLAFSRSPAFALARHAPGTRASAFLYFPGCQLAASAPDQVEAIYAHLRARLEGGVAIHLGCCGAPADWAGRAALAAEVAAELGATWAALGHPAVITACTSCSKLLRASLPDARVASLWEVLERVGLPARPEPEAPRRLAVHDACGAREDRGAQDAVRRLLARLSVEVVEPALTRERTTCCGYGGLQAQAAPAIAAAHVEARLAAVDGELVAYCAMCRDRFAAGGRPTHHLLDLVLGRRDAAAAAHPGPGLSARHENRARLKARLLERLWGERGEAPSAPPAPELPVALLARLEARMILAEDVARALEHAREAGDGFVDVVTGEHVVRHRPAAVTYWVRHRPGAEGGRDRVVDAWSHRMELTPAAPEVGGRGAAPARPVSEEVPPLACRRCGERVAPGRVTATYLGHAFPVELPRCPRCEAAYVEPPLALGKMLEVEQLLEDK